MLHLTIVNSKIVKKLTRNGQENFRINPKIGCSNFKLQGPANYSSPTNDLKQVRKKTISALSN